MGGQPEHRPRLELGRYAAASPERGEHLAFLGRIAPEKRPDLAIEVARRTARPLRLAATVDPMDVEYHHTEIEPSLGADVTFVGEIEEGQKPGFLGSAKSTLFPSDCPEPSGLVMIESMTCGTPVIALKRGSVPEVIRHGVSGFICDDVDEMVAAVRRLGEIDPEDCRRQAARFDLETMCAGYESVYSSVLETGGDRRAAQLAVS